MNDNSKIKNEPDVSEETEILSKETDGDGNGEAPEKTGETVVLSKETDGGADGEASENPEETVVLSKETDGGENVETPENSGETELLSKKTDDGVNGEAPENPGDTVILSKELDDSENKYAEEKPEEAAAEETKADEPSDDSDVSEDEGKAVKDTDPDYDPSELKGKAPNSEPVDVKKGHKPVNKAVVITIVVCAVIVIACLVFVAFKVGWVEKWFPSKNKINLCDISKIEVVESEVAVEDDVVDSYVESYVEDTAVTETLEEGTVQDGDTVNIDYVGTMKETGEEFEGGSAEDYDLTIGSGTFIDGFEEGLIGAKVGETVDLNLTFPEDYSEESLQGQDVVFTVTINSIERTTIPEYTDEWVQEHSAAFCPEQLNTTEEFTAYCRDVIEKYYKSNAILEYLQENSEVVSYDSEKEAALMEYVGDGIASYASMYGMTEEEYAQMYGYNTAEEYKQSQADDYLKIAMIVDAVCEKKGITITDEEVNASIEQYLKDSGYSDYYTAEEFKEANGETWTWLFTELEAKFDKAMESLYDNIVYVEEEVTDDELSELEDIAEEAADEAEDAAEDASDAAEDAAEDASDAAEEAETTTAA